MQDAVKQDPDQPYKVYYFHYRGLCEPIRLILNHVGAKFEDIRIERRVEWYRDWKHRTPNGHFPMLELADGRRLVQSTAIARFLGEKYGMCPRDKWSCAKLEELVDSGWPDLNPSTTMMTEADTSLEKKRIMEKTAENLLKPRLRYFEQHLLDRKTKFLVTDEVTWGDLVLFNNFFLAITDWLEYPLSDWPAIQQYCQQIMDIPSVKQWWKEHPDVWTNGPYSVK